MSDDPSPRYALFGNTQAACFEDASGMIVRLALPGVEPVFDALSPDCASAHFAIQVAEPHTVERQYVGDTPIFQTLFTTPSGGRASLLDVMPVRPVTSPEGLVARVHQHRVVRVLECHDGEVAFTVSLKPAIEGADSRSVELDANGLVFAGERTSMILQSEAEVHLHQTGVTGRFTLKAGEKRHFVLTFLNNPDPDVPEMRATEADWDLDGTIDFWLQWALLCPFQGVQRAHVMRLATLLKAVGPAVHDVSAGEAGGPLDGPMRLLAPVALTAWGWEAELARAMEYWRPEPNSDRDRAQAGWLLWGLADAQQAGLIEATLVVPHWPQLRRMADALAQDGAGDRTAAWAGLTGALKLADELLLEGDAAAWRRSAEALATGLADEADPSMAAALGWRTPTGEEPEGAGAIARCWRVRQELNAGAYLQARRLMDQLLQSYGPLGVLEGAQQDHADPNELALVLWTAAEIYLQAAPTPNRVQLPGDLGD